jgi:hypothetical protein
VIGILVAAQQASNPVEDAIIITLWLVGGFIGMAAIGFGLYLVFTFLGERWGYGLRLGVLAPFLFLAVCFTWPVFLLIFPFWAYFTFRSTQLGTPAADV